MWIGLNDRKTEGRFVWVGSKTKMSFTYWHPHNPDGKGRNKLFGLEEDCVEIGGNDGFKWNDNACSMKYYFLCETRYIYVYMQ